MVMRDLPGSNGFSWPLPALPYIIGGGGVGSRGDLDADGESNFDIFRIPVSGTLTHILMILGASITGNDPDFSVRLETVGSDGFPTGTLIATGAEGTISISSSDSNTLKECSINSGNGVSVTKNDMIAVVLKVTGNPGGIIKINTSGSPALFPYGGSNITGSWVRSFSGPNLGLKINGRWVAAFLQFLAYSNYETVTSNKERGFLLNVPFRARLMGLAVQIYTLANCEYKFVLYSSPTDSNPIAELTGPTISGNLTGANYRSHVYFFDSPFTLIPNKDYVLGIQVVSNSLYVYRYNYPSDYAALQPGVTYIRDSLSGPFSASTTYSAMISAIFDQIDDGQLSNIGVSASTTGAITKESGAQARGGSGACMKFNPASTTVPLSWNFLVPVTGSSSFTFSFYHKITTNFNGSVKVTIYDSDDDVTKLLDAATVTLTDDGAYHQYTSSSLTPTDTGMCRVTIEVLDGSTTGDVYIDDLAVG